MTTSNCGTNGGYSNNSGTATCTEPGATYDVNAISSPGCYACNWNGALLRVSEECFTSDGTTGYSYTTNDSMTVTYLTDDPTASDDECRRIAARANVYTSF